MMNEIEKSINYLKYLKKENNTPSIDIKLTTAISALEKQLNSDWIAVSDGLPDEYEVQFLTMHEKDYTKSDDVWVTYIENNTRHTSIDYTIEGEWINNSNVIAWQPLPKSHIEVTK